MSDRLSAARRTPLALAVVATVATLAGCASGGSGSGGTSPGATTGSGAARPVCPLTGRPAPSRAAADRPALVVKVDNISDARPQAGLNQADIVVQEQVEGGLTRLFAVYACHGAASVGPIRSARTTDADLLAMLHGSVFAYSGANPRVMPPIERIGQTTLVSYDTDSTAFHLDPARAAPHNVFAATATLLRAGKARHHGRIPPPHAWFSYGPLDPHNRKVHRASMSWPAASATWTWHSGQWLRTQDGTPDLLTGGQQVSATNVVVMGVKLRNTGIVDAAGNPSPDDVTTGKGPLWVLRDGRIIRGSWSRTAATDEWTLRDRQGTAIRLAPGRTWVELLSDPASFSAR